MRCGIPASSSAAASTLGSIAPGRRIAGRSVVQSTTVEAGPPRIGPPSMTSAIASPRVAATSAASRASGWPERLADVVGSGPRAAASGSRCRVVRDADADRRGAGRQDAGERHLGADRQHQRQAAGPEALGEQRGGRRRDPERPGLRGIGEQHGDGLLGRAPLGREQPLDGVRQREVGGDPVDGVGGDRDDPPGPQQLDGLGARRLAVGEHPGRRHEAATSARAASASASELRSRLVGRREDQRLDQRADAVLVDRRGDVPPGRAHHRRRRGHRRPVPGVADHLDVVQRVAHGHHLAHRDPGPLSRATRPPGPSTRPARRTRGTAGARRWRRHARRTSAAPPRSAPSAAAGRRPR